HFANGDIILAKITPCFQNKKSVIVKNLINEIGSGTTELYVYRAYKGFIIPEFILNLFKTEKFINEGIRTYTGTAGQQRVKKEFFENYLIALPPLKEQERIVKRVDELMAVCNTLESKIEIGEKINQKLLMSLLK
ncbi:MAG: restriction endonuclease subunit S, partial [Fusobacteriaceae bacterium]